MIWVTVRTVSVSVSVCLCLYMSRRLSVCMCVYMSVCVFQLSYDDDLSDGEDSDFKKALRLSLLGQLYLPLLLLLCGIFSSYYCYYCWWSWCICSLCCCRLNISISGSPIFASSDYFIWQFSLIIFISHFPYFRTFNLLHVPFLSYIIFPIPHVSDLFTSIYDWLLTLHTCIYLTRL